MLYSVSDNYGDVYMHDNLIDDILDWIEDNINKPISQSDLVKKSGYSQRYFQDLFFEKTGLSISRYILARKLSLASILLRLTRISIFEISISYSFNSQQSFSRAFKRYFKVTPIVFRKREFWDFKYYLPQHKFLKFKEITCTPVFLDSKICTDNGINEVKTFDIIIPFDFKSSYSVENFAFKNKRQINSIKSLMESSSDYLSISYMYCSDEKSKSKVKVKYIIKHIQENDTIFNEKGSYYYMFSFVGSWADYIILSNVVYTRELPRLNVKRRLGVDIEIFNYSGVYKQDICSLCYFIPVF